MISAGIIIVKKVGIKFLYLSLIKWSGVYDLPKGKCLDNEIILDCAIRELKEETNINESDLKLLDFKSKDKSITFYLAIIKSKKKVKVGYNHLSNLYEHYNCEWNDFNNLKRKIPKKLLIHINSANKILKKVSK